MSNKKESADVVFIQNLIRTARKRKKILLSLLPIVITVLILMQGIYTVPVNGRAALYLFGKLRTDNIAPGIHFRLPPPIHSVKIMNIDEIRSMKLVKEIRGAIPMITGDENIIQIGIAVQYKITGYGDYLSGSENWEKILNMAASACLSELIAGMNVDEVLTTGKSIIKAILLQRTQKLLKNYNSGISIFSVTIENIKPPTECRDSFRMVANARNEKVEKINIAQSNRGRRLSTARGEAVNTILTAESEANELIKESQGECYRYRALFAEYLDAKEYTVTNFYQASMRRLIANSEILLLNSENTGAIELNHFLQPSKASTVLAATTDEMVLSLPPSRTEQAAQTAPAAQSTALESVINIQKAETEVRRVHPPTRR